ncbi:hypothetical protein E4U55_001589 [Claviceps digitariae]|nr:hypothetical protein E4U55_001589 [Claviceps digitariae]
MELVSDPSLRDKIAHFQLMKRLTEDSDSDDGDGLAARQQQDRQRCMRFFLPSPGQSRSASVVPPRGSTSTATGCPVGAESAAAGGDRRHRPRLREDDAKTTTTTTPIIKATQPHLMRLRARARETPAADETVIPDTRRVNKMTQQRPLRTPLSFAFPLPKQVDSCTASARTMNMDVDVDMDSPSLGARNKGRKRKRKSESVKVRPDGEQIFKGLRFYYIPNDDVAPVRRLRIGKAREFGALWTREPVMATHVIVDKDISYGDVEKIIGDGGGTGVGAGAGTKIVVNEEYPVDCIRFRSLLDHRQKKYWVPGQTVEKEPVEKEGVPGQDRVAAAVAEQSADCLNEATDFLELKVKPPRQHRGRRVTRNSGHVPALGTASGSHESSSEGGPVGKANETEVAPSVGPQRTTRLDVGGGSLDTERENAVGKKGSKQQGGNDELSQYITMMQEFKGLPLDNDEEDEPRSAAAAAAGQSDAQSDDEEEARSGSEDLEQHISKSIKNYHGDSAHARTRKKAPRMEEQFACHRAGAQNADANNPNSRTIEVLQRMADYYNRINDHWRTTGYRKAISTLKRHNVKITSEQQALQLPHIGARIAQKIEEIATTNELRRLKYAEQQDESTNGALQLFLQIYGVGTKQAQQWLSRGYRTLDDLRAKAKLNPSQQIGIDHLDDLNSRIPRHEVEALGACVRRAAAKVDPSLEIIIGGSYRRGSPTSGDIDCIVTQPDSTSTEQLQPSFTQLLDVLTAEGFLTARLAHHHHSSPGSSSTSGSKFHGCCVLPPSAEAHTKGMNPSPWRRIDFLLVPASERGAALIYFTGNDIFNRSMRLLARRKGMRLNQRGLFGRGGGGEAGELVEGRCERRIFEVLGVQWREPRERWC